MQQQENWYVLIDGQIRGPINPRDIDVLLRTCQISSKTLLWKQGMQSWIPLQQIQQLKIQVVQSSANQLLEINQFNQYINTFCNKIFKDQPQPIITPIENMQNLILNKQTQEMDAPRTDSQDNQLDNDAAHVLQMSVQQLLKNSIYQGQDGKWNIYNVNNKEWVSQAQQPKQEIQKMKRQKKNNQQYVQKYDSQKGKEPQKSKESNSFLQRAGEKKKNRWYHAKQNTYIYVSGLPEDIAQQQLKQFFQKAGVLRIDPLTSKQKIKIYKNQQGVPKGDAAISFSRKQSVQIALQVLNQRQIKNGYKINIQRLINFIRAYFKQKSDTYIPRQKLQIDKINIIKAKKKQEGKLTWNQQDLGQGLKIIILKNMFTSLQVQNNQQMKQLRQDIKNQIEKIGQIQRIRFFQTNPQGNFNQSGIVEIKFKKEADAQKCIQIMQGRYFDNRKIECFYWDGKSNYRYNFESQEIEKQREQQFVNWLNNEQ